MECAVITTYRCNARCRMCNSWKNPTRPEEEFSPEILKKIPGNMVRLRERTEFMLDNKGAIEEMGRNARKFVEENFNPEVHYKKLIDIYQKVMQKVEWRF